MKFAFRKIKHIQAGLDYGFCLILDSLAALIEYEMQLKGHYEVGLRDAMQAACKENPHPATDIGYLTVCVGRSQGKSVIEAFIEVTSRSFQAKMRALSQFGKVYIHNNLQAFFVPCASVAEYGETVYRDCVTDIPVEQLPEPRFIKWEGGKHYYVKCGIEDVVVDDQQKWGTLEEAKAAFAVWRIGREVDKS